MSDVQGTRFDKYLWTVRLFKTRSLATDACRNGRVLLNGSTIKPSRIAAAGDLFTLRRPPATFSFRIIAIAPSRVSASLVSQYLEDQTPESERSKLDVRITPPTGYRQRGTGRPTKKERRDLDRLDENLS